MKRKRLASLTILLIVIAVLLGTVSIFVFATMKPKTRLNTIACTQEAKLCSDGSAVGRTGPNCTFAPCPEMTPTPVPLSTSCNGPGDKCPSGYTCIQKCGPPVVRADSPPPGYSCELNSVASKPRMCPICLASNTMIATPSGDMRVTDVRVGTVVWSVNNRGEKVLSKVSIISNTPVPKTHQVVHLVLDDGREVWVSRDHPTILGSLVRDLHVGDTYDASRVISTELVPYWDNKTYDLLPNSDTGEYWANGILLGSTLLPKNYLLK